MSIEKKQHLWQASLDVTAGVNGAITPLLLIRTTLSHSGCLYLLCCSLNSLS